MRRFLILLLSLLTLVVVDTASASELKPCRSLPGFSCGILTVPLDHADPSSRKLHLRYAVQAGKKQRGKPVIVGLNGGPGESNLSGAGFYVDQAPAPLTSKYRFAVIDQRGTGRSGALNCPSVQNKMGTPKQVGACGRHLGPSRAFYSTRESVADLDALRVALGQKKLAIFGTSYGSFVAQQYARIHPSRTRALVLDAVVGPRGINTFWIESFAAVPRVLRELCSRRACAGVTRDSMSDLTWVQNRLRKGAIRGRIFNAAGKSRKLSFTSKDLFSLLMAGDNDAMLRAATPAALAAARRGNPSLLLRQAGQVFGGGTTDPKQSSRGLYFATTCADQRLPYSLSNPFDLSLRLQRIDTALVAINPDRHWPFDTWQVKFESQARACSRWPRQKVTPPSTDPLPDIPALLLEGKQDLRTPLSGGNRVAKQLPQARLVRVAGTGHSVASSDFTGCVETAIRRWVKSGSPGDPCRGKTNGDPIAPLPPDELGEVNPAPGVPGRRGRAVRAAIDTAADAFRFADQMWTTYQPLKGGGLHGGSFKARKIDGPKRSGIEGQMTAYRYLPGLRVTGSFFGTKDRLRSARVKVYGKGFKGHLCLTPSSKVTGRINGHQIRSWWRA